LILSVLFLLVNGVGGLLSWYYAVNERERILSLEEAYKIFAATVLAKYLPLGKALQFVPLLASKAGENNKTHFAYSFVVCNILGAVVGVGIAMLGTLVWLNDFKKYSTNLMFLGVALVMGLAVSRPVLKALSRRLSSAGIELTRFTPWNLARLMGIQLVLGWLAEGAALVLLIQGTGREVSLEDFAHLMTSYAIASLAGYLAVITPGGIGVREGLFALLLQPRFSTGVAAYVAIAMRVASILADVIFSFGLLGSHLRESKNSQLTPILKKNT